MVYFRISWNEAFLDAISDWNINTNFRFKPIYQYSDPCIVDGLNGVDFVKDLCGTGFGKSTLAVTVRRYKPQVLGPPAIVEADIYVNENISFDIFDGATPLLGTGYPRTRDFRRVILHELGHVIGLDHEESQAAIMQPEYGEIFNLEEDDISGVNFLYGGLSNCEVQALRLGNSSDVLSSDDCTVRQLTVGGSDESLIDVYKFNLDSPTEMKFSVNSQELEAVIIVADDKLNYLANDSTIRENCGAELKVMLPSGDYFLLINTFDRVIRKDCGVSGEYKLMVGYKGKTGQFLGPATSVLEQTTLARFVGRITADDGLTYGNHFLSSDSIDATATIQVDPAHVGENGFLVTVGLIGQDRFWLDQRGKFVRTASAPLNLISLRKGALNVNEEIQILKNFEPSKFGIEKVGVEFYVGYGLEADPDEIYFHTKPINLTIEKE